MKYIIHPWGSSERLRDDLRRARHILGLADDLVGPVITVLVMVGPGTATVFVTVLAPYPAAASSPHAPIASTTRLNRTTPARFRWFAVPPSAG
jgi:hypothetical protein